MVVVVRRIGVRIEGRKIPTKLLTFLRTEYGEVEEITESGFEAREPEPRYVARGTPDRIVPGAKLRTLRMRRGLTQTELGTKLGGVSAQNVCGMEAGRRGISKAMARKLATVFQVPAGEFV